MARIFIDLTEDESHWNGEIEIQMHDSDDLTGKDCALAIGEHQIVLTVPQAITLFDVLDGWLNGGPLREVGAVERRVIEALKMAAEDFTPAVKSAITKSAEGFARSLYEYMKMKGLRFRLTGDEDRQDDTLWKRHQYWRKRREGAAQGIEAQRVETPAAAPSRSGESPTPQRGDAPHLFKDPLDAAGDP